MNYKEIRKSAFLKAGLILFFFAAYSLPLFGKNGRKIMQEVREQSRLHKTTESDVYMQVTEARGKKRQRYFSNKKKIKGKHVSHSIIKFYRPPSVKGTGLLTISREKESKNNQWIYLPALRSLRQLSSSDKNKSFMGSDFTNNDIAGRELDRDKHTFIKTKGDYDYVKSVPKDKNDPYSKLLIKVHRKIHVIVEVVFYDRKGKKLKILENKKIKKVKGMYMPVFAVMSNYKTKGKTSLKVSGIKVGHSISDNEVGIKGLRK